LALYDHNGIVGGLGVSGDTSCADHNIAWRVRQRLKPDQVPAGPNPVSKKDGIIYDVGPTARARRGNGHPACGGEEAEIARKSIQDPGRGASALLAIKGHVGRKRMTVGNLSRELLVTQHSGSELVERLVAKGLLVREPGLQDRRPMLLWVTPAANKLLSQMAKAHLEELRRLQPTLIALFQRFGGPMHGGTAARG